MLKFISVVFIATGFTAYGFYLSSYKRRKTEIINDVLLMISVIETRISYACLPVSDLLRILCESGKFKHMKFIEICREKCSCGVAFPLAWKESIEADGELCKSLSEGVAYLIELGNDIGSTDLKGQMSCCEYYKQIFQKELAVGEENAEKYSKLYPALGLMTGISAAIIIV